MDFGHDPLSIAPTVQRQPFDANQAIARIVFERSYDRFQQLYPHLRKLAHERLAYFVYPLSGGFDRRSFLPMWSIDTLLRFEQRCRYFGRLLAFRLLVVLEKHHLPNHILKA
jgi:hypothetical protein